MSAANDFRPILRAAGTPRSYEFGPFTLDTLQHALLKEGKPVGLTPKTYDTLLVLVQNRGRMLSKEELMKTLWPDSFVEESNLTQQVSMIRRALGESASDPRYIATVTGRGYRFDAEVRTSLDSVPPPSSTISPLQGMSAAGDQGSDEQVPAIRTNTLAAESAGPIAVPRSTTRRWVLLSIAALAVLAVAVVAIRFSHLNPPKTAPSATRRSLAILPLQNLKQDPGTDFLGFSLADAVITKLDYVSSLNVRPSTMIEGYRGKIIDIQKVATDLNVDTLLTGGFIRDGDNLRITYQLIDVKTEKFLGKGTIDLKYDNLLRVQDSVAGRIIDELQLQLSPSEAARIQPGASISPLAYEYYLRGVDLHGQHNFPLAIKMLEKSTQIDPNYAPAWAYLGASYTSDAAFEFGGREQYRRAKAAYERALAIQPSQLDAQIFLANLLIDTGKVEEAVPLLRDALKTNPNYAAAHWELGYAFRFAGMLNESVAECERALQLDPLVKANGSALNAYLYLGDYDKFLHSLPEVNDSLIVFYRGFAEYHQKNWEGAARDFDRAFEIAPTLYTQIGKALSDSIARKDADGLQILHTVESKIGEHGVGDPEAMYKIAQAYSALGDRPSALRALRQSVQSGFFSYPYIAADPLLEPVRHEVEFSKILDLARRRYEAFKAKFF